ncbi:PREDICTED: zinc finger protein 503 [Dipodomys ordii]|uniref:Zinc finger protein 503 n=1 Tax=Dipodomys ordii TaxID=10020 RepID=A0A1S3FYY8_DIPOR|nr:PREDICTED: zinc finger protein 503 [Dipodomys ordii]
MSTAPSLSALRSSKHSGGGGGGGGADPAWTSAISGNSSGPGPGSSPAGSTKPFVHAVPPSDPLRQANRLPIKVLKMLTARTGHILHPEYLQPLPSTPVSPIEASLCRDPYCLSYHCASHLAGAAAASASCAHDPAAAAAALKSGYPLVYPTHPLHGVHSSLTAAAAAGATPPSLAGHPLYPYGFMLPNDPLPHICNWVSANGPCDKRFATSEELLSHLRTHTAFPGTDKLLSGYPSSSSLASAAAAAMACHMHIPTSGAPGSPGTLALRSPHHALGLSSRYHPYSKSPLPTPGAPVPVPAATGPYYSPYALYGQRLTTASALGYQ